MDSASGKQPSQIDHSLEFSHSFDHDKAQAINLVRLWGEGGRLEGPELDEIQSPTVIKNGDRIIVRENAAFRNLFVGGSIGTGSLGESFVANEDRGLIEQTDQLLLEGVNLIELEHVTPLIVRGESVPYLFRTYKARLDFLSDENLCFIEISRPITEAPSNSVERRRRLSRQHAIYLGLDDIDRRICRLYCDGESTKYVAEKVGLTTRSVEVRRQKILEALGLKRPVDIVKLIVRFEENRLMTKVV